MTTFDPTKPCKTRDGCDVVIYCTDAPGHWPIHGRVDGLPAPCCWRVDGTYSPVGFSSVGLNLSNYDLVNAKQRKEAWVNVYPIEDHSAVAIVSDGYKTEAKAKANAGADCIATVKIEWEE